MGSLSIVINDIDGENVIDLQSFVVVFYDNLRSYAS
jgi:hypothetical protein